MLQAYVSSIRFIRMLQVFYLKSGCCKTEFGCCMRLQWLSSVFRCFVSVSDVCCKCFNCFERILQVFYLDVAHVKWDHLPPPPAAAAGALESVRGTSGPRLLARGKRTKHERQAVSTCRRSGEWRVRSRWCGPPLGRTGCRCGNTGYWHQHECRKVSACLHVFGRASSACGPGGAGPV